MKSTCAPISSNVFSANDIQCATSGPKSPFTIYHNGKDAAKVINQSGEDVTGYFNIEFVDGVAVVGFKTAPSFEEWRRIAGKRK